MENTVKTAEIKLAGFLARAGVECWASFSFRCFYSVGRKQWFCKDVWVTKQFGFCVYSSGFLQFHAHKIDLVLNALSWRVIFTFFSKPKYYSCSGNFPFKGRHKRLSRLLLWHVSKKKIQSPRYKFIIFINKKSNNKLNWTIWYQIR